MGMDEIEVSDIQFAEDLILFLEADQTGVDNMENIIH